MKDDTFSVGDRMSDELYTQKEVEQVCADLVQDILATLDDVFRQLDPLVGNALRKAVVDGLTAKSVIEPT